MSCLARVAIGVLVCASSALAEVTEILPIVLPEPKTDVEFDLNIRPGAALTEDAINMLNAQAVARQQVQAAINYLVSHEDNILRGQDAWFNEVFGGFYDPTESYADQIDRTTEINLFDEFNNRAGTLEIVDPAFFETILSTFEQMEADMAVYTDFSYGAHFAQAEFDFIVDTYLFPKWGLSTSLTSTHADQIANMPNDPLVWHEDNEEIFILDPVTGNPVIDPVTGIPVEHPFSRAFFNEKLDLYGIQEFDIFGNLVANHLFVGGAFLNEEERPGDLFDGTPRPLLRETEFKQYQMIIQGFVEFYGAQPHLFAIFGEEFVVTQQGLDSGSFARFADLTFASVDGGVGRGDDQPPRGKNSQFNVQFTPIIP